jgi:hypothetical protein
MVKAEYEGTAEGWMVMVHGAGWGYRCGVNGGGVG